MATAVEEFKAEIRKKVDANPRLLLGKLDASKVANLSPSNVEVIFASDEAILEHLNNREKPLICCLAVIKTPFGKVCTHPPDGDPDDICGD